MSALYLFLLGSRVDGAALLGAAVKEEGRFFHTYVSILSSDPLIEGSLSILIHRHTHITNSLYILSTFHPWELSTRLVLRVKRVQLAHHMILVKTENRVYIQLDFLKLYLK